MSEGDRERVIIAEVIARAWKDEVYRAKLLRDPRPQLAAAGLKGPPGVRVTVLENTPRVAHLSVPRKDKYAENKERFLAEFEKCLPLPEGVELRLYQNTELDRYLVLPLAPDDSTLSDAELMMVAGGGSNAQATVNVTMAVNVQTAANATTTVDVAEVNVAAVAVVVAT